MSTANKLTYLNTTKGKIKDSINITGVGITDNDTFRSYSAKLKDGIVDMINNGTDNVYNNFPKATDTGSDITLNNTYNAPMKMDLKGNTYQKSYTGKNLLNNTASSQIGNGITFTKNADGTVLVNGTATALVTLNIIGNNSFTLPAGNYYLSGCPSGGSDNLYRLDINNGESYRDFGNGRAITLSSSLTINNVRIRIASGTTLNNLLFKPMIEKGTSKTEYEPYVGGTSPNPDYPQNIEVVTGYNEVKIEDEDGTNSQSYEINLGKNLCNGTSISSYVSSGGIITSDSTNRYISTPDKIKVKPNTTYTITFVGYEQYTNMYVSEWNGSTFIGRKSMAGTFTTSSTTNYVYVHIFDGTAPFTEYDTNIQLEQGSNATPFSPYKTPIELCKIGTYQDEIRKSTGKNLFDKDNANVLNGYFHTDSTTITSNANRRIIYIPCKINTTYTVSFTSNQTISGKNLFAIGYTTELPTIGVQVYNISSIAGNKQTTTTGNDAKYIIAYVYSDSYTVTYQEILDSLQLEEGSTLTEYEPYGVGVWYKYSEIGKVILDGSNNFTYSYTSSSKNPFRVYITGIKKITSSEFSVKPNLICDDYSIYSWNTSAEDMGDYGLSMYDNTEAVAFRNTSISSLEDFKTSLSTNNATVYYALATPTITILDDELQNQLNELESANSYLGQTNITAEYISGNQPFDMSVSALLKEV